MRKFIIISLLWAIAMPMLACAGIETDNYYMFSLYNRECFHERTERLSNQNWLAYLGKNSDYYWFNADEIIENARQKNDLLMVSYVQNLEKYLDCARQVMAQQWEYPTKAEIAKRNNTLQAVAQYALSKTKSRLRSQHGLLYMRCNMLLKRHAQNITFWEQTANKFINSVYRDMMYDIYAGALVKNGRQQEGAGIFAELGDWQSLMTVYYQKRSFQAIQQEYQRDPNSPVLPFLLQDFVNNAQEAVDGEGLEGKLFVRDITRNEAMQMCALAKTAASDSRSNDPCMWKTAEAWLHYLFGDKAAAGREIATAVNLNGNERSNDNATAINYFINAAADEVNAGYDKAIIAAFEWLKQKHKEETERYGYNGAGHYLEVCQRLIEQVLIKKYHTAGQPLVARCLKSLGSFGIINSTPGDEPQQYLLEYTPDGSVMSVEEQMAVIDDIKATPKTVMERYLKPQLMLDEDAANDLIGTKYLRLCQWEKAIPWLQKVPMSYYNRHQGIAAYATYRKWNVEPWITRQWLTDSQAYGDGYQLTSNYKIDFAREMIQMEQQLSKNKGKDAYYQLCYDLAVRYAQADFTGDCWFIMRDSKSYTDELRAHETDLKERARQYLSSASQSGNLKLRERALFALCYGYLNPDMWYREEWNSEQGNYDRILNRTSQQWKAWTALASFEKEHGESSYVSRCDEYRQFMKN